MTDNTDSTATTGGGLPVIKPRMVDGVGWCSRNCPHAGGVGYGDYVSCDVAEEKDCKLVQPWTEVCPLWAARMAAWAERAHGSLNWLLHLHHGVSRGGPEFEPPCDQEWTNCLDEGMATLRTYPGGNDQTQDWNGGE